MSDGNTAGLVGQLGALRRELAQLRPALIDVSAARDKAQAALAEAVARADAAEAALRGAASRPALDAADARVAAAEARANKAEADRAAWAGKFDSVSAEAKQEALREIGAGLRPELDAALARVAAAEARAAKAEADRAAYAAKFDALPAIATERADYAAVLAEVNAARDAAVAAADAAKARAAKAEADRTAFAAKFDALHGEAEPGSGIAECSGYVTADGRHHATLEDARRHLMASEAAEISRFAAAGVAPPPEAMERLRARLARKGA